MTSLRKFNNYIGGKWVAHCNQAASSPSSQNAVLGGHAQVESAVRAGRAAFSQWANFSVRQRSDVFHKITSQIRAHREELARLVAEEHGKDLSEALLEVDCVAKIFELFANQIVHSLRYGFATQPELDAGGRQPLGVIGMVTSWKLPIATIAWKIAPALAFGNCVVMKPAHLAPTSIWAMTELISRAGVPAGVFNLLAGDPQLVGDVIAQHPHIDGVCFTGHVREGRHVGGALMRRGAKAQLEIGMPVSPMVLDDTALLRAVEMSDINDFYSQNRAYPTSSRVIITRGIHDSFVEGMIRRLRAMGAHCYIGYLNQPVGVSHQREPVEALIVHAAIQPQWRGERPEIAERKFIQGPALAS